MVLQHLLTVEEYLALPEEKPYLEYVRGQVVQKMTPKRRHVSLAAKLLFQFALYERRVGGFSGPEPTIAFIDPADLRYLVPDAAYWAPDKPIGGEIMSPPTVAVEVRSEGQSLSSLREKCDYYRAHGVDAAWLVDPERRVIEVWDEGRAGVPLSPGDELASAALPGFTLDVATLFAAAG